MGKKIESVNKKSKPEHLFIIVMIFGLVVFSTGAMGCGFAAGTGNSFKVTGATLPGCESDKGCVSCGLPYQCTGLVGCLDDSYKSDSFDVTVAGCDNKFYGKDCAGCKDTSDKHSCYTGCIKLQDGSDEMTGCFYNSGGDGGEKLLGCYNGGFSGCASTAGEGGTMMFLAEEEGGL